MPYFCLHFGKRGLKIKFVVFSFVCIYLAQWSVMELFEYDMNEEMRMLVSDMDVISHLKSVFLLLLQQFRTCKTASTSYIFKNFHSRKTELNK